MKVTKATTVLIAAMALAGCGDDNASVDSSPEREAPATTSPAGPVNNAIDCSQYPADSAAQYHEQFLENCRNFAMSLGYADATLVPMETLEQEVELAGKPPTCPAVNPGNLGLYCVGLDKQPR